jgi:hypothetical protein
MSALSLLGATKTGGAEPELDPPRPPTGPAMKFGYYPDGLLNQLIHG